MLVSHDVCLFILEKTHVALPSTCVFLKRRVSFFRRALETNDASSLCTRKTSRRVLKIMTHVDGRNRKGTRRFWYADVCLFSEKLQKNDTRRFLTGKNTAPRARPPAREKGTRRRAGKKDTRRPFGARKGTRRRLAPRGRQKAHVAGR